MQRFVQSVRSALESQSWYAALGLALALPDICGHLEGKKPGRRRYIDWCSNYLTPRYTHAIGPQLEPHVFLQPEDCYALRCAFLHSGMDDITEQQVRKVLDRFVFISPPTSGFAHCNQVNLTLQLQVDVFCVDVCEAVTEWEQHNAAHAAEMNTRAETLLMVQEPGARFRY